MECIRFEFCYMKPNLIKLWFWLTCACEYLTYAFERFHAPRLILTCNIPGYSLKGIFVPLFLVQLYSLSFMEQVILDTKV
jgi:hypothetical protein